MFDLEDNFRNELIILLNKYSKENGSNTPDFILAVYLNGCLGVFDAAVKARDQYLGIEHFTPVTRAEEKRLAPVLPTYGIFRETPLTEQQLSEDRAKLVELYKNVLGGVVDEFTCDKCDLRYKCLLAFDAYNTDGDCLAEK